MCIVHASVGRRYVPLPEHSILLEGRKSQHRWDQFHREPESGWTFYELPCEVERETRAVSYSTRQSEPSGYYRELSAHEVFSAQWHAPCYLF